MNIERLGWVAAAALAGGMIGMGFKAPGDKTGTVDVAKVFKESDYAKKQTEGLRQQVKARQDVMEFIRGHRNMKGEDASKLRDLSIKEVATPADSSEITRLKTDADAAEAKARELQTVDKPTAAQLSQLDDFTKRKDATGQLLEKWGQEFQSEFQGKQEKMSADTLQRVKDAIQQVGKDQGYSMIFSADIAPFSPNDVTADAMTKMNAKK